MVDATGIPLAWSVTGGNRNDVTQLIPLLDRVPPVKGAAGRPRRRPDQLVAGRGYDHDKYRRLVRERGITPVIARRKTEHGSGSARWLSALVFVALIAGGVAALTACRSRNAFAWRSLVPGWGDALDIVSAARRLLGLVLKRSP